MLACAYRFPVTALPLRIAELLGSRLVSPQWLN
jgi:hypothetical protein